MPSSRVPGVAGRSDADNGTHTPGLPGLNDQPQRGTPSESPEMPMTPRPHNVVVATAVDRAAVVSEALASDGPETAGIESDAVASEHGTEDQDPEIEALELSEIARTAAYALKRAHPSIRFTSGRRNKEDQARAMASNVVKNRRWIEQTYRRTLVSAKCQAWIDANPDRKTQKELQQGLLSVLESVTSAELGKLSKHLSGDAFDVQPVDKDAAAIKKTIESLPGKEKFLDREGGLVRWHVQFK